MRQRIPRLVGLRHGLVVGAAALIAFATSTGAFAQTGTSSVQIAGLDAEGWPQAQAVLAVLDDSGRPIAGLTDADFDVFVNDASAPVTGVEEAVDSSLPIAVVLALDVSGSMEGGALAEAKAASHSFLDRLAPDDTVAIVTFGNTVQTVLPFTTDRAAAEAAIDGLAARGATALYQATSESIDLAAGVAGGRRAVVILSDGVDNGSTVARDAAIESAGSLGAPVFAIGLGGKIDRAYLQALADTSGGRFAETPTPQGLAQLYVEVGELLRGQYIVSFDATELALAASDAATLRVQATVAGVAVQAERVVCPQQLCIALTSIVAGERIEDARTLVAEVVADEPIEQVTFLVDGVAALELTDAPYEFTLAPETLEDGEHTIAVQASTASRTETTVDLPVRIGAAGAGLPIDPTMLALVGAGVAAALAIAFVLLRRRGRDGGNERVVEALRPDGHGGQERVKQPLWEDQEPLPMPTLGKVLGELQVTSGPLVGEVFQVGGSPASIGCSDRCQIRLPIETAPEDELVAEHARVWVRDGQLMVHEMKRLTERGATGGAWQILAPGDDFSVWVHTFKFVPTGEDAALLNLTKETPADPSSSNGDAVEKPSNGAQAGEEPSNGAQAGEEPSNGAQAGEEPSSGIQAHEEPPNILRDKPVAPAGGAATEPPDVVRDTSIVREPHAGTAGATDDPAPPGPASN